MCCQISTTRKPSTKTLHSSIIYLSFLLLSALFARIECERKIILHCGCLVLLITDGFYTLYFPQVPDDYKSQKIKNYPKTNFSKILCSSILDFHFILIILQMEDSCHLLEEDGMLDGTRIGQRQFLISSAMSEVRKFLEYLLRGVPSGPIRNFSKFQEMSIFNC